MENVNNTKTAIRTAAIAQECGLDHELDSHHDSVYAILGQYADLNDDDHAAALDMASERLKEAGIKHTVELDYIEVEIYCGLYSVDEENGL